jgi:hypothetical protein
MEGVFIALSVTLFIAVWATMFRIVQDVFPYLAERDRDWFRNYIRWNRSFGGGSAIRIAWAEHGRVFPNSRKRVLLAALLVAWALSVIPLSLTVSSH